MCGIGGMFTQSPMTSGQKKLDFMSDFLVTDVLRGWDSTGISIIYDILDKDGFYMFDLYKRAIPGPDFVNMRKAELLLTYAQSVAPIAALGHNRAATKGTVIDANSHPFVINNTILTHNGTITNFRNLPEYKNFDVDSELICHYVNQKGIKEVVKEMQGGYALAWMDVGTDEFHLISNGERPLSFAFNKENDTMFYASEAGLLGWLMQRNKFELKDNNLFHVEPHVEYIFSLDSDNMSDYSTNDLSKHKPKTTVYQSNSSYSNSYNRKTTSQIQQEESEAKQLLAKLFKVKNNEVVNVELYKLDEEALCGEGRLVNGPNAITIRVNGISQEVMQRLKQGAYQNQIKVLVNTITFPKLGHLKGSSTKWSSFSINVWGRINEITDTPARLPKKGFRFFSKVVDIRDKKEEEKSKEEETPAILLPHTDEFAEAEAEIKDIPYLTGPDPIFQLTPVEYDHLVQDGCDHCGQPVYRDQHNDVGWTTDEKPICPTCIELLLDPDASSEYAEYGWISRLPVNFKSH